MTTTGAKVFTKNEFVEKEKWFEKEIRPSLKGTPKDLPYMQFLFYNTKEEFKDDQLFEENEIIKIRQNSFEQILEKLETYNLSDTQDDVKGIAFEQFLGTTFRGELGQYFTPRTIAVAAVDSDYDYIVNHLHVVTSMRDTQKGCPSALKSVSPLFLFYRLICPSAAAASRKSGSHSSRKRSTCCLQRPM